jgi:hypothetical protein
MGVSLCLPLPVVVLDDVWVKMWGFTRYLQVTGGSVPKSGFWVVVATPGKVPLHFKNASLVCVFGQILMSAAATAHFVIVFSFPLQVMAFWGTFVPGTGPNALA